MKRGMIINGMRHLSPKESLEEIREGAILVDLRNEDLVGMKAFDVENTIHCRYYEFEKHFQDLPTDKDLILADSVGLRSKECVQVLLDHGYTQVANLAGGIMDWERDGLPIIRNRGKELNGPCLCMLKPGRH
jgi:rhodanese-related sulfurtransferase